MASAHREIVRHICTQGRIFMADESRGHSRLNEESFIRETVNHTLWFIDHDIGARTQRIEHTWIEAKRILKKHRRPTFLLQSHLGKVAWRRLNKSDDNTNFRFFGEMYILLMI